MANKYVTHAIPTEISATSRCAIKIRDNYYTIEATEKRTIADVDGVNMDLEYKMLFDEVNGIVDSQCQDIIDNFKK